MADKRILLASTESDVVDQFRQSLGAEWTVTGADNTAAALELVEREPYEVVVADLELAPPGGAEILARARQVHPTCIRFVLAAEADRQRVVKHMLGAHQFLNKPVDLSSLKGTLQRAVALDGWIGSDKMRELVARVHTFPTIPSLYLEVLAVLRSPSATTSDVGAIIGKDLAMCTKLLQMINSAYFSLSRRITDPAEAVGILGFETVKSMVIAIKLVNEYDKLKPVYFSIDRLWQHSMTIARLAKQLTLLETQDTGLAEAAFTAGLMHDVGKVVLAANFDEQYRGVQSLAAKQHLPVWEVEREIFGAHHGEIGAYLLGLWGLPLELLEAAALHHCPSRDINQFFTPLTAVHVANVLQHEAEPDAHGAVSPQLDETYLQNLGLLNRVEVWRKNLLAAPETSKPTVKPARAVPSEIPVEAPGPVLARAPLPDLPRRPASRSTFWQRRRWAYSVLGLSAMLGALAWIANHLAPVPEPRPVFAHSRTDFQPRPASPPPAEGSIPPVASTSASDPGPAHTQLDASTNSTSASGAPTTGSTPAEAVTSAGPEAQAVPRPALAAPTPPPPSDGFPPIKLQGVFLSSERPSAILNGKLVELNDRVAGARVVEISSSRVVIEFNGQQKTLKMK